jgi:tetratricopeptide (TPR) repeat protein
MKNSHSKITFIFFFCLLYLTSTAQKKKFDNTKLEAVFEQASKYFKQREYDKALEGFQKLIKQAKADREKRDLEDVYNYIGYIHSLNKEFEKALFFYYKVVKSHRAKDMYMELSSDYIRIGYVQHSMGFYQKALGCYDSASYFLKKCKLESQIEPKEFSRVLGNITYNKAHALSLSGKKIESIPIYEQSVELYNSSGNRESAIKSLRGLGKSYKEIGYYEQGIKIYLQIIDFYVNNRREDKLDDMYNSVGVLYKELNEWESARNYYEKALLLRNERNNPREYAHTLNNLGNLYYEMGQGC